MIPRLADDHPFRRKAVVDWNASRELAVSQIKAAGPLRMMVQRDTPAVYDAREAGTTRLLVQYMWAGQAGHPVKIGASIPWSPSWMPGDVGNDRTVIIHNPDTLETWDLWMVGTAPTLWFKAGGLGDARWWIPNWSTFSRGQTVAVAQARNYKSDEPWSLDVIGVRGSGGNKIEGLVYLEQLELGHIDTAIGVKTPRTRVGPDYFTPARRSELSTWALARRGGVITVALPDDQTTPPGTSWRLNWDTAQCERHASKFAHVGSPAWRAIVAVFVAFVELGTITQETAGQNTGVLGIETDWTPQTAARWSALGVGGPDTPMQRALATIPPTDWSPVLPR